mgnify:CR=1 FL=1
MRCFPSAPRLPERSGEVSSGTTSLSPVPWPAIDGLGRRLPLSEQTGPHRADRFVGIFYFLWHGAHDTSGADGPFDVSRILQDCPDALRQPTAPPWGPEGAHHYWGEPLFGYYRSDDEWVLRRHAFLLADAGVDTLIFDTTNRVTYRHAYRTLCRVFSELRTAGERTPGIAFMCNTKPEETARELYEDLYAAGDYRDLWFRWEGKPLLICDPAALSSELREFFTLRKAHWPFEMKNTPFAWHWEATHPQPYGYTEDPQCPEQMNVSVAQNLRQSDGQVTPMSGGLARGRCFHDGCLDTRPGAENLGLNFGEQWQRALDTDPPFVMITGWNEWTASRFRRPECPVMFVDQFDQQCSRDIEMAKAHHADHYYWQMAANIRRYKGTPPLPTASKPVRIDLAGGFEQWAAVRPEFRDHANETIPRNHPGVYRLWYANRTGRNEIRVAKIARDAESVYFFVQTARPLTSFRDSRWMQLHIDADLDPETGPDGYEFVVNRTVVDAETALLERYTPDGRIEPVTAVPYRISGPRLHVAIPRKALGLDKDGAGITFDFSWTDNVGCERPLALYTEGDAAPLGRYRYRYTAKG